MKLSRRSFLKSAAATTSALSWSAHSWSQTEGANNDIRVAVVGFGGRGGSHINAFKKMKGVRLVALCDADKKILDSHAKKLESDDLKVETYTDVRKLIENKNIDVVTTATPNHWHSLISIWAVQAGKDVYVEKPISHNVWEGRKVVEAARKHNRIVQAGTQSRSSHGLREAFAWVREGNLGKIKVARGLCYKRRPSIGKVDGPQPIPASVDYDLWCGPAAKLPLMRQRLHYDWHWVWNTGNGDIGNQGIHQMDTSRWALGKMELSSKIISVGGRFGYVDDGETPNTMFAIHDYGDVLLVFEVRGLPAGVDTQAMDKLKGESVGHIIECEGGYLAGTNAFDKDGKKIKTFKGSEDHFANFIKGVRSRKTTDLNADILDGHLSSALCHTANISYRLGKQASQDEIKEALKTNSAALETLARFEEHLGANNVKLDMTKATLGAFLQMDGKAERFLSDAKANALLTREYRKPFVVPEVV